MQNIANGQVNLSCCLGMKKPIIYCYLEQECACKLGRLPSKFRREFASCRDGARPELAGPRQQMAQSLAACRSHLPPSPCCQLEPDIPNCYDFLKVETKDSGHTLRSLVLQFILS